MNKIWSEIIIAAIAAFISWFFNRLTIISEIKKTQKDKINESRINLYIQCYAILEQNIADPKIVFESEYIKSLMKIKADMKVIASNSVIQAFKSYYLWVLSFYEEYNSFCKEKDPGVFYTETTPEGEEYEIAAFNETDIAHFELLTKKYIEENNIENRDLRSKIQRILDAMRRDLGNDKYIEDFHNKM